MSPLREIDYRILSELPELRAGCELLGRIWGSDPANPTMTADILRALTLVGNYAAGAYDGGELVGVSVGFFADPDSRSLHSHVTGVARQARGLGVGIGLKLHQRGWALARGVRHVSWTFDPLVRRNARFNLVRLAATAQAYLPDFYGPIGDALNADDESDRLLVSWELDSPAVAAACVGSAAEPSVTGAVPVLSVAAGGGPDLGDQGGDLLLVAVPPDIEGLRVSDPQLATAWRVAMREVLGGLLRSGATVLGFTGSAYLVRRAT